MMSDEWKPASDAPDGVVYDTIIRDAQGERNQQHLKRSGNLWFVPDGSSYVYYTPTHCREAAAPWS
jgi:hypothetical protein